MPQSKSRRVKVGEVYKSKLGGFLIEITGKQSGNRHWTTRKLGRGANHSHMIHEGTLERYYELVPSTPTRTKRMKK